MSAWTPLLLAAALLAWPGSAARRRIALLPRTAGGKRAPTSDASGRPGEEPRPDGSVAGRTTAVVDRVRGRVLSRLRVMRRDIAVAAVAAAVVAVVLGGARGAVAGLIVEVVGAWALHKWGHRRPPDDPLAVAAALDLLAACLRGGLPVADAVDAAAGVCAGGPGGAGGGAPETAAALGRVADLLSLGGDTSSAWDVLAEQPGLDAIARMARRSADSGASLAADAEDLAETFRRGAADDAVAASEKAGVAIAGPLGVCFLPAFVCLGIVPVIVGLAGDILGGGFPG